MSTLVLPEPAAIAPPGAASSNARRAQKHFQDGRAHAAQAQWPQALRAYEQAASLSRDAAYALAAGHAAISSGQPQRAVERLRALRAAQPDLTLAYTLESHAWLELARPDAALAVLQALPTQAARDHIYHVSLAVSLQRMNQHQAAVQAFLAAQIGRAHV